jgi:hypothetical protein
MTKMQLEALERYKQYKEEEDEKKKIEFDKKKQMLDFLKDQMETDLKVILNLVYLLVFIYFSNFFFLRKGKMND